MSNSQMSHKRGYFNEKVLKNLKDNEVFFDLSGKHGIFIGNQNGKNVDVIRLASSQDDGYPTSCKKLKDYLFELTYSELDYDKALDFLSKREATPAPGCSSIREGDFLIRNFDWYYSNNAEFVIKIQHSDDHFKSVGIVGNVEPLTDEDVERGTWNKLYEILPFMTVDGINEYGVAVSTNVTSIYDDIPTTGTNPGKPRLSGCMIPRHILDHFKSAQEAVDDIANNWDIFMPHNDKFNEEMHFIVADKNDTFIIEFADNEVKVVKNGDSPVVKSRRAWMTNFKVYQSSYKESGVLDDWSTVEAHGAGLERSDYIANFLDEINGEATQDDLRNLLYGIRYSQAYELKTEEGLPQWKTELCGIYSQEDLKVTDPITDFKRVFDIMQSMYTGRDRSNPVTWQSVHSSIYNLTDKSLTLYTQEDYDNPITFSCKSEFDELLENEDFIAALKIKLGL